jgi:NADH dehydrogenase
VRDSHVVINLVGILFERSRQQFDLIQAAGAETVALSASAHGARLIHVSALGADENSTSAYARSKAKGEKLVHAAVPGATILRPSIIFGPEDDFFNKFAALARMMPALPLIGGGTTRFQPVYVGDVADAVAKAVAGAAMPGATYELGGPEIFTFRELMEFVLATIERKRLLVPVPFFAAKIKAGFLQFMPKPLLTPDQVELLRSDNVVSAEAVAHNATLAGLGISPAAVEAIVPTYLWRFRKTGQFQGRVA